MHPNQHARIFLTQLTEFENGERPLPPVFADPNAQPIDYQAAAFIARLRSGGINFLNDEGNPTDAAWDVAIALFPAAPAHLARVAYQLDLRYGSIRKHVQGNEVDRQELESIARLNRLPVSVQMGLCVGEGRAN